MDIKVEIAKYEANEGLVFLWQDGAQIELKVLNGEIIIRSNREGLTSLASHLLNLAQDGVPRGEHFHLDDSNGLEDGSCPITVERV